MRKKIIAILFVIITIIYIILGAFLFLNIQLMETPEIIIDIEVGEISSNEAVLHATININNPNGFEIVAKNLEVVTKTSDGFEVARILIEGGEIGSHKSMIFTKDVFIAFNSHNPGLLTSKITGEVGVNIWFIKKTIPLNVGVVTSIEKIINEIVAPNINVMAEFIDITTDGIVLNSTIDIYNPNTFNIYLENISTIIETETGEIVGNLDIIGNIITAKSYSAIKSNGKLLLKAFNFEMLIFNITGVAGAKIAGFKKNLPFSIQTRIKVPDLEEMILSKDKPTILSVKIDEKITLKGIIFYLMLEINNSYRVDLQIRNLTFRIYTVVDNANNLIGENKKIEEISVEAGTSGFSSSEILVPFSKIFPIDWSIDWIMASATGRVTIKGVDQSIFLEIRGYHSVHPFT